MSKAIENALTIKVNGKDVQSKPFDFEDYAIIQNRYLQGLAGSATLCDAVLIRMFAGTVATKEYIETLPIPDRSILCDKIFEIYRDNVIAINELVKNQ